MLTVPFKKHKYNVYLCGDNYERVIGTYKTANILNKGNLFEFRVVNKEIVKLGKKVQWFKSFDSIIVLEILAKKDNSLFCQVVNGIRLLEMVGGV